MEDHEAARLRAAVEQIEAGIAELRSLLDPAPAGEPAPENVAPGIRAVVEAVRDLGGGPVTLKDIAHHRDRKPGSIRYAVDAAVSRGWLHELPHKGNARQIVAGCALPAQPEPVARKSPVEQDAVPAVREAILSALAEHPEGLDYRDLAAAIGREHNDPTYHVARNALLREGRVRLVDTRLVKRRGRMVATGGRYVLAEDW
jgi:hypothetical protein